KPYTESVDDCNGGWTKENSPKDFEGSLHAYNTSTGENNASTKCKQNLDIDGFCKNFFKVVQ
ncbi:MAG: hypothetical protein ABIH70_09110, partial [Chloroflexota bacterium]